MAPLSRPRQKRVFRVQPILFCMLFACFMLLFPCIQNAGQKTKAAPLPEKSQVTMTILYDNYGLVENAKPDWGFSCLIQGTEKTILFDTGMHDNILLQNCKILNLKLNSIDQIVISHDHGDHTGGLVTATKMNPGISVYVPNSFSSMFDSIIKMENGTLVRVDKPMEICRRVHLTGEMGDFFREQSLILDTSNGLVIITGCSHQGIVNVLKRAKKMFKDKEIYMVFGGFHLLKHPPHAVKEIIREFKALGVKKCGATHCTGASAIALFKEAFGENYVSMGVGKVVQVVIEE